MVEAAFRWLEVGWRPCLEVAILWFVYYRLLLILQGTRALQVLLGMLVLVASFFIIQYLQLEVLRWLLERLFAISVVVLVVVFQPELRRALARIVEGRVPWQTAFLKSEQVIPKIVQGVVELSKRRLGALIAFEREVGLGAYMESGVVIKGLVSAEFLVTLFTPPGPLHDGGVVIQQNGLVAAAGCLFPLSQIPMLDKSLGTRHRAAVGLTEESDAIVLVVSEETGTISASIGGQLTRDLDETSLTHLLERLHEPTPKPLQAERPAP